MTNTERRQYILDYIKNSSVEAFTNLRLQTLLLELNDDTTASATTDAANTTALSALSGANYTYVIVTGEGIFKYASSGTPNGTTIFAATGGGVWSLVFNAGVDTPQLSTPVLTLTVISDTQINATWPSVTDAANYQLYRATAIDFTGETLVYDGALLLFNSTGLSASTTYYFRLKARGYERMNSAFDTDSASTNAQPQLATPTGFTETGVTSTTIDYNWNDVASATNYIVERSASGAGVFTQIYSGATSAHTDTGRTASTTYDYRCKAQAAGFADSAWATDSATTGAVLPTGAILIFQWGQSNAVGRADADAPNEVVVPAGVYEYKPTTDSITGLADPTGEGVSAATSRSLNPNLGKRIKELTTQDVIILPAGKGNTPIADFINTGAAFYTDSLADWNALKAYCATNAITITGAYAHFLQGENNAGTLETDGYLDNLNTMIDLFDTAFAVDKSFVTRIGYDPSFTSAANSEKIMRAQNILDFSKDQMLLTSKAASTFTTGNSKMKADGVHYTVLGYNEIGEDIAEAINQYRTNNKKVAHTTEPVVALQDAVGYFDDIYNFRSLTPGDNADLTELYGRNNLTQDSGTGLAFDGTNGLTVAGYNPTSPTTVRTLTNAHDWTIEATFSTAVLGMLINGRSDSGNWTEDWLWINSAAGISFKGGNVSNAITLAGADLFTLSNLALVYTTADNTLKTYVNSVLKDTRVLTSFASFKAEKLFRSNGTTPATTGERYSGTVERIRIVKKALAVWEFDRSPNIGGAVLFDYDFQFNSSIAEAQGDISTAFYTYAGAAGTPAYDADGVVFPEGDYMRLASKKSMANATVEFRIKDDVSLGNTVQFICGGNPQPDLGGFTKGISRDGNDFRFGTDAGTAYWNLAALGLTHTNFNSYKIVYNGTTAALTINGTPVSSVAVTGNFEVAIVGAKHPTQTYSFKGTMDYFKVKNSI